MLGIIDYIHFETRKRSIFTRFIGWSVVMAVMIWGICGCFTPKPQVPAEIEFITTGSSFAPVIQVTGSPEVLWTWADGETSSSLKPVKNYSSPASRVNKLRVTPWSALTGINIGYDGGDGGSGDIPYVADQHVSSVQGLEIVAHYLQQWCSSYNEIHTLDFHNFDQLNTIECFLSQSLASVNLANTPALKRACFEDCNLSSLDLSQSPNLEDLRGANNVYPTINFGDTGSHVWHICVRDNPQMTNREQFADMSQFPGIAELFIWNDNQTGQLKVPSTSSDRYVAIIASGNEYTSADFSGALQNASSQGSINLENNQLTHLNISGCVQLTDLNAAQNNLDQAEVDSLLQTLDTLGREDGTVDLHGNTAPSANGLACTASLEGKGWTVTVDQ